MLCNDCMKTFQTSFFDESKRLAALSRLRDPLEELSKHIDFNMFRPILTEALRNAERKSPAGRKPLDVILMFKALIIQRLFNLSDEKLEYQIQTGFPLPGFWGFISGRPFPIIRVSGVFGRLWSKKGWNVNSSTSFQQNWRPRGFLPKMDRSSMPRLLKFPSNAIAVRKMPRSKPDKFLLIGMKTKAHTRIPMLDG